jgi:hypothetical protein
MSDSARPESVLYAAYIEEAEDYARAERLAGELAAACGRGEPLDDRLQQVLDLLKEIAARDARIAPVKESWMRAGRPTGAELRAVMDRIAALIGALSGHFQILEQAARSRRDALAAELDDCNRRRQMQRAYLGGS